MKYILVLAVLLSACSSHSFIPTGEVDDNLKSRAANCGAKVLTNYPKNTEYKEIGICLASAPGGGALSDNTSDAVEELQKCACLQGGNAVIWNSTSDVGLVGMMGYSQATAKARGIVLVLKTK